MRLIVVLVMVIMAGSMASATACDLTAIMNALEAPLTGLRKLERDVSDVQSTEGGVWQIFREEDGRINSIVRIDGGESGRNEARFSAVNRRDYGVSNTRIDYIRHAFVDTDSPFGIAKRTTSYYYFCDGRPYVPPASSSTLADSYPGEAKAALGQFLKSSDIAEFTKGFVR